MRKKILNLAFAVSMVFMMLGGINAQVSTVCAEEGSEGIIVDAGEWDNNLIWILTEDGTLTISGNGRISDCGCLSSEISSVIINSGVTGIDDSAFYGISGLTSITIPDSVTSIGDRAFEDCSSLTSDNHYPPAVQ